MKTHSHHSTRLAKFLVSLGTLKAVFLLTTIDVILALGVTAGVAYPFHGRLRGVDLLIAIAAPVIIGVPLNSIYMRFIIDLEHAHNELRRLAITDDLTSLYNRRHFRDLASREFDRALYGGLPFSLILFDFDDFKVINDNFGHGCGDQALETISRICLELLRPLDILARYGGEEFILMLPETNEKEAMQIAERLRTHIADSCTHYQGNAVRITISAGVATLKPGVASLDDLILHADQALYLAKNAGKNRVAAG